MRKRMLAIALASLLILYSAAFSARSAGEPAEEASPFTLSLELYDKASVQDVTNPPGSVKPLDTLHLKAGQEIVAVIHYSGLQAMNAGGIQCLAASFSYDPELFMQMSCFEEASTETAGEWSEDGAKLTKGWAPEALRGPYYTASASDRLEEGGKHRIYIQYIAEEDAERKILTADEGYIGAVTMTVMREFDASSLDWADYAVGLYGVDPGAAPTNYSKAALSSLEADQFAAPENLPVSTKGKSDAGVTVKGLVESFAPKKVANLYLFKKEGDSYPSYLVGTDRKQINEDAAAAHTTIGGAEETEVSGIRCAQPFTFDAVEPGTYRLLIVKPGNTFYIVNDIEVGSAPVDLQDEAYAADVRKMTLIAGDLNGNGMIDSVDVNYIYTQYWGDTTRADADLNNNGMVDSVDANIIYAENWNKTDVIIQTPLK